MWLTANVTLTKMRDMMNDPRSFRILLVEDDSADALLAQSDLAKELQFVVFHVECLDEAARVLRNIHTDAIVLDLGLSDFDGIGTLIRLRHEAPETPIIVLSSSDRESYELECAREGAHRYLVKGAMREGELRRAVRFAIECEEPRTHGEGTAGRVALDEIQLCVRRVAHTLNNLLTVMIGQCEMATTQLPKGSRICEDLNEVLIAGDRATALTDELLSLGRNSRQVGVE